MVEKGSSCRCIQTECRTGPNLAVPGPHPKVATPSSRPGLWTPRRRVSRVKPGLPFVKRRASGVSEPSQRRMAVCKRTKLRTNSSHPLFPSSKPHVSGHNQETSNSPLRTGSYSISLKKRALGTSLNELHGVSALHRRPCWQPATSWALPRAMAILLGGSRGRPRLAVSEAKEKPSWQEKGADPEQRDV